MVRRIMKKGMSGARSRTKTPKITEVNPVINAIVKTKIRQNIRN